MKSDISIIGEINEELLKEFTQDLMEFELRKPKALCKVLLSSSGGDAHVAMAFYDLIKLSPIKFVVTGTGLVASAASLIFIAFEERKMTKNAYFMVHEDSGDLGPMSTSKMEKEAKHARRLEEHWNDLFSYTKVATRRDWKRFHKKETYFNADQCLNLGLIKEIV